MIFNDVFCWKRMFVTKLKEIVMGTKRNSYFGMSGLPCTDSGFEICAGRKMLSLR